MFFEGCIRRLSAAVQIAIQCQHICGRAFAGHPQKAKKPPALAGGSVNDKIPTRITSYAIALVVLLAVLCWR